MIRLFRKVVRLNEAGSERWPATCQIVVCHPAPKLECMQDNLTAGALAVKRLPKPPETCWAAQTVSRGGVVCGLAASLYI